MYASGLLALLLSSALSSSAAGPARPAPRPATAAAPPATSSASATEVELEVVEHRGGKPTSFGFLVPIDGSVEAWIERDDDPRRCEVKAHETRRGLWMELRCDGSPDRTLRVTATRTLTAGKRTRIAEVTRPAGGKSQVYVTLR
jgi:hypothetical protein